MKLFSLPLIRHLLKREGAELSGGGPDLSVPIGKGQQKLVGGRVMEALHDKL